MAKLKLKELTWLAGERRVEKTTERKGEKEKAVEVEKRPGIMTWDFYGVWGVGVESY